MVKVDRSVLDTTGEETGLGPGPMEGFTRGLSVSTDLEIKGGVSVEVGPSIRLFFLHPPQLEWQDEMLGLV
jgi:hypothetical protein